MKTVVEHTQYSHVRGFNYQPSYASHGIDIWIHNFNPNAIRKELALGKKYFPRINTIRLWLSFDAFLLCSQSLEENFDQTIKIGLELDLKFIVTLFNACPGLPAFGHLAPSLVEYWSNNSDRYDQTFRPYIDKIVGGFADNKSILMWDLCNEPGSLEFVPWLEKIQRQCKTMGTTIPITVGACPDIKHITFLEPLSDVITFHPYFTPSVTEEDKQKFVDFVDSVVLFAARKDKPILASETGWGDLDDEKRAETLKVELSTLKASNLGFLAHLLHYTLVFDGHKPEDGPVSHAGYMAFINKDGNLRPFHDIFNQY